MQIIILAGGSGTRLWPLSRKYYPKQFLQLFDDTSLFQKTLERNEGYEFTIVTNENQFFLVKDQAEENNSPISSFLLEPVGRNTAPAIALACLSVRKEDVVLVTPSDHLIKNVKNYKKLLKEGEKLAKDGFLVTFGIKPTYPATGYGYIEANGNNVKSFKEKPELKAAKEYVKKDNFFWNSGMFMFRAGTYLDELQKYAPPIYKKSVIALENGNNETLGNTQKVIRIKEKEMLEIPEDSIDYAVIEKSDKVKMLSQDIEWSDLGSFDELYKVFEKDKNGNAVTGETINIDSKNNLILSDSHKTIATVSIDDLMIIETPDALLISKKGASEKVKEVVKKLQKNHSSLTDVHLTVHRPWGNYTVLLEQPSKYKIKRIVVPPKRKLSLQKHFHRNEHWIVVSGTAKIQNGEETYILRENESTFIPMGQTHRLENPGKIDLVMIEAQVGQYLDEDDIVRYEDDFKRK